MRRILVVGGALILAAVATGIGVAVLRPPRDLQPAPVQRVPVVEEKPAAPRETPPPIRISFDANIPPELNEPVAVTLVVQRNPETLISGPVEVQVEILLRLPVGVQLADPTGWQPVALSPNEQVDASGPWSLFERVESVSLPVGEAPQVLAQVPISLKVVEQGVNWVITARARIIQQGELAGQAFGVLFATLEGEVAEFHAIPKTTVSPPS